MQNNKYFYTYKYTFLPIDIITFYVTMGVLWDDTFSVGAFEPHEHFIVHFYFDFQVYDI